MHEVGINNTFNQTWANGGDALVVADKGLNVARERIACNREEVGIVEIPVNNQ